MQQRVVGRAYGATSILYADEVHETHLLRAFLKLRLVNRFLKLLPHGKGLLATWRRAVAKSLKKRSDYFIKATSKGRALSLNLLTAAFASVLLT